VKLSQNILLTFAPENVNGMAVFNKGTGRLACLQIARLEVEFPRALGQSLPDFVADERCGPGKNQRKHGECVPGGSLRQCRGIALLSQLQRLEGSKPGRKCVSLAGVPIEGSGAHRPELGRGLLELDTHLSQAGVIAAHIGDARGTLVPVPRVRECHLLSKSHFCLQH